MLDRAGTYPGCVSNHDVALDDAWPCERIMDWLRTLDEASAPREINWWLRVAVLPQQRAYDGSRPDSERREWAEVYLSLILAAKKFARLSKWDAAASAGNLRSLLITQLGSLPDHPVWDVAALVRDTLAVLTLTPDEAGAFGAGLAESSARSNPPAAVSQECRRTA